MNGDFKHKSYLGGCASIFIYTIVLYVAAIKGFELFGQQIVHSFDTYMNAEESEKVVSMKDVGFMPVLSIVKGGGTIDGKPLYADQENKNPPMVKGMHTKYCKNRQDLSL